MRCPKFWTCFIPSVCGVSCSSVFLVDLGTQRLHRTTVLMRPNLEWARWLLDCQWGQSHKDPEGIKQVLSTMLHERNVTSEVPCRSNVGQWLTTPLHTSLVRVPCGGSKHCFVLGLVLVASVLTRDCFLCIHVLSIWFHGKDMKGKELRRCVLAC